MDIDILWLICGVALGVALGMTFAAILRCLLRLASKLAHQIKFHTHYRSNGLFVRRRYKPKNEKPKHIRNQRKPEWARRRVIQLKIKPPAAGCRTAADLFNRTYADSRNMTVSKSWVSSVWQAHRFQIMTQRRKMKNRKPLCWDKNLIWQVDLTQIRDLDGQPQRIFGCIDTGTRACLAVTAIPRKTSLALLKIVSTLCKKYGPPGVIQTDNEACFTSYTFRLGLYLLGITHETTELASPWQNGRIERFFRTFKEAARQVQIPKSEMTAALETFRNFYNNVRTRSSLAGKTPAEAWSGKRQNFVGKSCRVEEWDGVLEGIYFPP